MTPERIGKYEIKRLLGEGATGSVYLAADPFGQRDVALKVMKKLPSDPEAARRQLRFFQNEAALAGKLRHPHIVSILDAGVADSLHYLVMELVEGAPLTRYCGREALLEPSRIVGLAYKTSKALEFANSVGVVHRDIKPANIMVKRDFDIKVADFGAAQLARSEITQVSGVGSPAYMSPEQLKDEETDFRTDMYSLGAVLYHLITGERPFDGANTDELMQNILNQTAPLPSARRPDAPRELDEIVARAMAKARAERYESWDEFGGALAKLLALDADGADLSDAEKFAASRRLKFFDRFSDAELWEAMRLRVQDIDTLSESCRARFNEAFLAIMAERLTMLGGRLIA